MNLQIDKNMRLRKTFFSLMFLFGSAGISVTNAQSLVVDPALAATLVLTHKEQQDVLKDISKRETEIRNFQLLISTKMAQLQQLQEKTYSYLSTVNAVVKNGKDIIYASQLAASIAKYQREAANYAADDPKLLLVIAKTEYELITRSADLFLYIYNISLQGGESNLLDNKQRIDLCIHVVDELRKMRAIAYSVCRQMKTAKRAGILKSLAPGQFRYVNTSKQKVERILNDVKFINRGGY